MPADFNKIPGNPGDFFYTLGKISYVNSLKWWYNYLC